MIIFQPTFQEFIPSGRPLQWFVAMVSRAGLPVSHILTSPVSTVLEYSNNSGGSCVNEPTTSFQCVFPLYSVLSLCLTGKCTLEESGSMFSTKWISTNATGFELPRSASFALISILGLHTVKNYDYVPTFVLFNNLLRGNSCKFGRYNTRT